MNLEDYVKTRIRAIKDTETTQFDGLYRDKTLEQREARLDELANLLNVKKVLK